ncbi:type II toxin-antitoxin system RelB/DinJ family antitoxin [Enterococcus sp. 669A]|uniref:Type II toxin-antitoxin system RelB/DinJ family antitoxin n=1 Tax=Candidatus Enterococcus moelleringii TaxID=2815325 RepID=A0ABS3LG69_9ENTE|nr:type II toxin-antitoxin system RelB/DinJ family antitoxin [Enterococcus sp. 669A]MBO1308028.1 type II toxin-antitoxin system RelB/DinJ family antitoxin [Enterococcus sp. 669A]
MTTKDKKKVQVNIDKSLASDVDIVLDSLGLNPTVLITALYKRVAAKGEIPFSFSLTEEEKADISLMKALDLVPTVHVSTMEELNEWLDEDE